LRQRVRFADETEVVDLRAIRQRLRRVAGSEDDVDRRRQRTRFPGEFEQLVVTVTVTVAQIAWLTPA
jgi:hypothetical protein